MAGDEVASELSSFLESGIYRFPSQNAIFMDPVRVLNDSYTRFKISPSAYYSRFCDSSLKEEGRDAVRVSSGSSARRKKRKRRIHELNQREISAEKRHQATRPFLLRAHEEFLVANDLLSFLCNLKRDGCGSVGNKDSSPVGKDTGPSFVDLGCTWQAPLYEMSLYCCADDNHIDDKGTQLVQCGEGMVVQAFNNLFVNESSDDKVAEFLSHWYIIPRKSCFHMSDLGHIHELIPVQSADGFNLIVIDPPWENGSAHQKSVYPTLPNRYFLSLPVKQLTHTRGALVALWVTNREKLWVFVEKELFPAWGITNATLLYWLKGTDSEHQPAYKPLPGNQVLISIPGHHSRKPPLGKMLSDYIPGPKPARCIELFARELTAGWTSWGNEILHFQESRYFMNKFINTTLKECC
ncbi:methyltransferase-like protein 2 isoform X2 [Magnolia sinica]|uniref:methyltransferase-like protein 2 isoform X2 n=1 Tax=Magnolia sinica TaxID=86752 RepID=UPI00265B066F|nr:methyltransferase-like protein 2 isoform X2 [Magnolia sinica]